MIIPESKLPLKSWEWVGDFLALTLLFAWILTYPMHGFFLQIFEPQAYILGHVFTASHGLGLIISGLLPLHMLRKGSYIKLAGVSIFILTFIWTVIPQNSLIKLGICGFLGLSSAYLVLAWACVFIGNKAPALTLGASMALTNVLLGLVGFAHNIPETALKTFAALTGLAPLLGAFYIARSKPAEKHRGVPEEQKKTRAGLRTFMLIAGTTAVAYFTGGLWYRAVLPAFYSKWPDIIGIDSFIYAFAVLGLAFYARKHSFYWVGTIGLSTLGIGLAISMIGLDRPSVGASTLIFLATGLGAIDLFYWLTLRKLSFFLGTPKSFGFGLGISLFFITAPGIALDTGFLTDPLLSPVASVIGASLLFLINPLLVFLLHPLPVTEPVSNGGPGPQNPAFWDSLTSSEKNVYELICKGRTDAEIAVDLFISRHTVKFHARNILRKAGVSNRKELLAKLVGSQNTILPENTPRGLE